MPYMLRMPVLRPSATVLMTDPLRFWSPAIKAVSTSRGEGVPATVSAYDRAKLIVEFDASPGDLVEVQVSAAGAGTSIRRHVHIFEVLPPEAAMPPDSSLQSSGAADLRHWDERHERIRRRFVNDATMIRDADFFAKLDKETSPDGTATPPQIVAQEAVVAVLLDAIKRRMRGAAPPALDESQQAACEAAFRTVSAIAREYYSVGPAYLSMDMARAFWRFAGCALSTGMVGAGEGSPDSANFFMFAELFLQYARGNDDAMARRLLLSAVMAQEMFLLRFKPGPGMYPVVRIGDYARNQPSSFDWSERLFDWRWSEYGPLLYRSHGHAVSALERRHAASLRSAVDP